MALGSVRIRGDARLRRNMNRLGPLAVKTLGKGLFMEGEKIMAESKQEAPVDKGILRASGHVQPPKVSRNGASVTLGYGGAAEAYALIQHERTDYQHTVGKAKYLEDPVKRAAPHLPRNIGTTLEREIARL